MAIEIFKVSNELAESVNDSSIPLLKHIQPKLRAYESVFCIRIIDKIKTILQH